MHRLHSLAAAPGLSAALLAITVLLAQGCTGKSAPMQAASMETKYCTSTACLSERFAQCQPTAYTTPRGLGVARYDIMGPTPEGCRLSLTYTVNPNPAWVDKPLILVLDPAQPLKAQLKAGLTACLAGNDPGFHCSGPLFVLMGGHPEPSTAVTESPCGQAVKDSSEPLYPLPRDGKWGYVNRAGDWVIEPRWRQAAPFSEGRAFVDGGSARGSYWGIIDRQGNYVIEPSLGSQSFVTVKTSEKSRTGSNFGSPPARPFSQGCAAVTGATASDGPYFVTRDGGFWLRDDLPGTLADLDVREFGSFSEGKAWFRVAQEEFGLPRLFGWIDTNGAVVVEPTFEGAGDFVEGLAPAASSEDNWGYIDASGTLAWPRKWTIRHAYAFSDGMAAAMLNDDREMAYTDGKDWVITELHFTPPRTVVVGKDSQIHETAPLDKAGSFSNGLAPVQALPHRSRSLFYINTDGDIILEPGKHFTICDRWGYKIGIPKSQLGAPEFRHGLARLLVADDGVNCGKLSVSGDYAVNKQAHYIYIDAQGHVVLEEPFRTGDIDAHPEATQ